MNALPVPALRVEIQGSARDLPAAWDARVEGGPPILQRAYLQALAEAPPPGTEQRFVLGWRGPELVAAAVFHVVAMRPGSIGRAEAEAPWLVRMFFRLLGAGGRKPALLVCGNVLHADLPGVVMAPLEPDPAGTLHAMAEAVRRSVAGPLAFLVLKSPDLGAAAERLPALGYHRVGAAQPTMQLRLDPRWQGLEDYLAPMQSKYRQRARAARRHAEGLVREELDAAGILVEASTLDALLRPVLERAEVVLAPVPASTLAALKRRLGEDLRVVLYRLDGRPVAFSASLRHPAALEAMLVGTDETENREHRLYQNALYDFVEQAIAARVPVLDLGRGALEIKSTIGAEPWHFDVFVRHPNPLWHWMLGQAARRIPRTPWVPRHPFKGGGPAPG